MRELRDIGGGQVHIACVPSVAMKLVPRVINRLLETDPMIAVKIPEVPRGQTMEILRTSEADLASQTCHWISQSWIAGTTCATPSFSYGTTP